MRRSRGGDRRPAARIRRAALIALLGSACGLDAAQAIGLADPFATADAVSPTPAGRMAVPGRTPCRESVLPVPLSVLDTVRRALCHNPKTREAWANVEAQAAAVGIGESAYLPTLSATVGVSQVNERDTFPGMSEFDSSLHTFSNEENISLNWVLYDFGLRAANLRYARALLDAASASQDDAVQLVFITAAQAFFGAEAAQASLAAATEAEQAAQQSFEVADGKAQAGAGAVADQLQAKTAYAQASLKRIQAADELRQAAGAVAVAMGLRPDTALTLPQLIDDDAEQPLVGRAVNQLIEQAMRAHPKIVAAKAQLDAAQDNVAANRAGGRPSIAFAAVEDRSDNPINRVSSKQQIETSSIGLQLSIPLFEGFSRTYKIRKAEAEAESRQAELSDAEQQVAQEVWKSYLAVHKVAEDIKAIQVLLTSAEQSFSIAQGRYKAGVGSILELLKAQSDLASAKEQRLLAVSRWHLARLQLGASLGQIGFAALQERPAPRAATPAAAAAEMPRLPALPKTEQAAAKSARIEPSRTIAEVAPGRPGGLPAAATADPAAVFKPAAAAPSPKPAPAAPMNPAGIEPVPPLGNTLPVSRSPSALPSAPPPLAPIAAAPPMPVAPLPAIPPMPVAAMRAAPSAPMPIAGAGIGPAISSISPNPVSGSFGPQVLTIGGSRFLDGARINLRDKTHGLVFLNRMAISRDESRVSVRAELGCSADWTVEIVNPDGHSSGEVPFKVIASCVVLRP